MLSEPLRVGMLVMLYYLTRLYMWRRHSLLLQDSYIVASNQIVTEWTFFFFLGRLAQYYPQLLM